MREDEFIFPISIFMFALFAAKQDKVIKGINVRK